MAKESILEFFTPKRQTVLIDDQEYELRSQSELKMGEFFRWAKLGAKFASLTSGADPGAVLDALGEMPDDQIDALFEQSEVLADKILEAPDDVKAKLGSIQKLQIVQAVFLEKSPDGSGSAKNGAKFSRSSRGSTAARRGTGSKRRSGS